MGAVNRPLRLIRLLDHLQTIHTPGTGGTSMRVRPFFWILLTASCVGVLVFAATWRAHVPAVMQVHVAQHPPATVGYTTVALHLMDEQGLPIEAAQVSSQANMTNMEMISNQSSTRYLRRVIISRSFIYIWRAHG